MSNLDAFLQKQRFLYCNLLSIYKLSAEVKVELMQ